MPRMDRWSSAVAALGILAVVTTACYVVRAGSGLRAQYFNDRTFAGPVVRSAVDSEISTATVYRRWKAAPPDAFSVQWSGYLHVDRPGLYTFAVASDHESRVYLDRRLVVENKSLSAPNSTSGEIQLGAGPHHVLLQYIHSAGRSLMEWSWSRDRRTPVPIPDWALSTAPEPGMAALAPWLDGLWWSVAGLTVLLVVAMALHRARLGGRTGDARWLAARVALAMVLASLYAVAATRHASEVNTFKARGDQNGYLWDAEQVYANFSGRTPPALIGMRARMPMYAAYLSLFYTPRLTDPEFFVVAKAWNIRLSVVLLVALSVIFAWHLPPIVSTNLSLIGAFGYFVFKAGYAQPELLFYVLFFIAFLGCWHLLLRRERSLSLLWGLLAGTMAGLAYLTKALVPPFVALFLAVYAIQEILWLATCLRRARHTSHIGEATSSAIQQFAWRAAAGFAMAVCFLAVVYPYIANSKRAFGQYFYNVNTTYYIWYDNGVLASYATYPYTDQDGRVLLPAERLANPRKYWSSHTFAQIFARLGDGFKDMLIRSYTTYAYLKYVVLYLAFALALIASKWREFLKLVWDRAGLFVFLLMYAAIYLVGTAFFVAISGTGSTRFLLAHAAPFFFVLSSFFARAPFSEAEWSTGRLRVRASHFHLLIVATMAFELTFTLWGRIMSTYGGF